MRRRGAGPRPAAGSQPASPGIAGTWRARLYHIALLFLAATAFAQQAHPPLDQLLSAPFPTSLVAAPAGGHIAWVLNDKGARNIWVASPEEYQARAITSYTGDDGFEIAGLGWSPDASRLVFVRWGIGVEPAVWSVPLAGGDPVRLGDGGGPVVSPQGDRVVFTQKGKLQLAALDGSAKVEQPCEARGEAASPRWSTDSAKIAFVSQRGDHSYIALCDPAARKVTYLDPSLDKDSHPTWSPNGDEIAFLREPTTRAFDLFGPKRAADPWSIRIVNIATGKGRRIFEADPGRGSVFQPVTADNQILWAPSGHVVFPWERDGWTHLYSLPVAGDAGAKLLTFGDFEVEHVALTPDGKEVIYSANSDDIDRRHIFRVPAAGGPVNPVTSGKGIEWSPVMTSDGKAIAFLRSDAKTPARAAILVAFGSPRDLVDVPFPTEGQVEPQPVEIAAADGMRIRAQLFLPAGASATSKRPAVIFFHGGSRRQMLLGWHYMAYYHNAYAFNQYLASQGYVVLSVNFRSGIGYGMEFREALDFGATGASEFNDVMGAGLFLQNRPEVDGRRIGLWGGSYGGYLTALGLARASNLFAAGVDVHGVHDWNVVIRNFRSAYNPLADADFARRAFQSSPLASVKTWKSPVLLVHGDDDRNVPFSESVTLAEALRKQGVEYEELVFPDEVHSFLKHSSWTNLFRSAADFLDRRLKNKK